RGPWQACEGDRVEGDRVYVVHRADTEPYVRADRPIEQESRTRIIYNVGHKRVSIALTGKRTGAAGIEEPAKARQPVVPVTVFFLETPWTVLQTQPAAGIDAASVARAAGEVAEKRTIGRRNSTIDPERHRRNRGLLIREVGPPALGSDVEEGRVRAPNPTELRIRLGAPERHGKSCDSA